MMIKYFQRIPSAAARNEVDGNLYAYSNCRLKATNDGRITVVEDSTANARMLRVETVENGEARVYLGMAGDAIAERVNLPFSVVALSA